MRQRGVWGAVVALLLVTSGASAQTKLAGTFQIGACGARPSWSSFALLIYRDDFAAAAECSRRTGLRWVLYLTADPYRPIDGHVAAVKQRAQAAGLAPFVVAVTDHEEWYELTLAHPSSGYGWPIPGLDPSRDADIWRIAEIVHAWASARHLAIKRIWPGVLTAWITSLVNDDRRYGAFRWRPLPAGVDVIALEGYVPRWGTWASTAGLHLAHAIRTRTEPIVLVTQGFRWDDGTGGDWSRGPTDDQMAGTASALAHPRVVASWLFTWDGNLWAAPMVGLRQMPEWEARYAQAIGVTP